MLHFQLAYISFEYYTKVSLNAPFVVLLCIFIYVPYINSEQLVHSVPPTLLNMYPPVVHLSLSKRLAGLAYCWVR